ncbi:hypothetical protein ACFLZP_03380 [Patescibacteria group bacterium]
MYLFLLLLFFCLFVLSFFKIKNSKNEFGFIYPYFFVIGAFVWEDLLIFSCLGFISVLLVLLSANPKVGLLLFLLFWLVRSAGEVLYYFLQQFLRPKFMPLHTDKHFILIRKVLGNIPDQKGLYYPTSFFSRHFSSVCLLFDNASPQLVRS